MPTDSNAEAAQRDLFSAETTWFHVFRSMFTSGDVAKMGPYGYSVYSAIKAHTNFLTGVSFPGVDRIAEISGMSRTQVKRGLATLQEMKYLTVTKQGRQNVYKLREKVEIQDEQGRPHSVATWDYLPSSIKAAVADLKNVIVTGNAGGASIVHIERIVVNVNNVQGNQINVNLAGIRDPDIKKSVKDMLRTAAEQGSSVVLSGDDQEEF